MMPQSTLALVFGCARAALVRFFDDERGSMSLVMVFTFLAMIMFGGIAVDVMRFETRRVALQQTLDRAVLAAASLQQTRPPKAIVEDWFAKAGLKDEDLEFVDFSDPRVTADAASGIRRVRAAADVRSKNFFMGIYSPRDYFETELVSQAEQGTTKIEVMLVLDITYSMGDRINGKRKIESLRDAATNFVNLVKRADTRNNVSIGIVPYAAQVNIPVALREQFNVLNLSSWDGVDNVGVPGTNCLEIPTDTYGSTALSRSDPIRMAAVADADPQTENRATSGGKYQEPLDPRNQACSNIRGNLLLMPTKDANTVRRQISQLTYDGNTYIAVGMRWATALMDDSARPIYTAIADSSMAGRPAANDAMDTRKIIILMTDGQHAGNGHILDDYKTGPSPIWRGEDGKFAIRFYPAGGAAADGSEVLPKGPAITGIRPGSGLPGQPTCSGWTLANYADRQYFIPREKREIIAQKLGNDPEGVGKGKPMFNACDPRAWKATPSWDGSGSVRQLDWSEVWRYVPVSWVVRQLYMRSGVAGTDNYDTLMNQFRGIYLTDVPTMDALLQQNCAVARDNGIEIYGIAFNAPEEGIEQIRGCSSMPKTSYFFDAANGADLDAAFKSIAEAMSNLKLTQ